MKNILTILILFVCVNCYSQILVGKTEREILNFAGKTYYGDSISFGSLNTKMSNGDNRLYFSTPEGDEFYYFFKENNQHSYLCFYTPANKTKFWKLYNEHNNKYKHISDGIWEGNTDNGRFKIEAGKPDDGSKYFYIYTLHKN